MRSTTCSRRTGRSPIPSSWVSASSGRDASLQSFGAIGDQIASLREDVRKLQSHPLITDTVAVGGFLYDVQTGLIEQKF